VRFGGTASSEPCIYLEVTITHTEKVYFGGLYGRKTELDQHRGAIAHLLR
jgi:hypothetical protein